MQKNWVVGVAANLFVSVLAFSMAGNAVAQQKSRTQRMAAGEVYWASPDEPPSMDPTKQVDMVGYFWLGHLYEGLLTYDVHDNIVPGTAESYQVSPDHKTWTFKIRKNAVWHDGKPVVAADFIYAWQRLVDPEYASEYAFIAQVAAIENADDIVAKKKPKETLGAKAIDDHTIEVKLVHPVAFFDSLMAFQPFYPVRRDIVEKFGHEFAADERSIVGNGPYKMASWHREQSMRLEKAPNYWNAKTITINAIESPAMVKDAQANYNNLQTGGIDFVTALSPEIVKQAQGAKMKVSSFAQGCANYMALNVRPGRPFADKNLRLAVQAGINRAEFVNRIVGLPASKPLFGMVPDFLPGSKPNSTYRAEAPIAARDADTQTAQKYLKTYLAEHQGKVPAFTLMATDEARMRNWAEYWQSSLTKLLGTQVKIETVPFKTMLQKTKDGQFDAHLGRWCPDYRDAMTYIDLYTSKNDNNLTGWTSNEYDALVEKAAVDGDMAARVRAFAAAEKLLREESPVVPIFQNGAPYLVTPDLKGVKRSVFGLDPDLRFAHWASPGLPSH